jgi:hypothetical protein
MALVLKDRVKETSTTTGTGTLTLAGASSGYQSFAAVGNGNTTYYTITDPATGDWEVGIGTYTSSGTTLSRTTILSSSNAGSAVNFTAGTKDVFCVYPAGKAVYEEANGETLINGGPITVVGSGVTSIPTLPAELGKFVGNADLFAQIYCMNQSDGSSASADFVAYNDLTTDGFTNFIDMGINSSNYTSLDYPIFTPGSGYLFHDGDHLFIGTATSDKDVVIFTGGVDTPNEAMRILGTDQSVEFVGDVSVGGTLDVTGAASFGSTVLLNQDPTLALQAATKQYVDNQVTAGLHIHDPVLVETTGNLNATYAQGGTTFNITDITGTDTVTTSTTHGLSVGDQIWLTSTAGNGLSTNTAYFVFSVPASNQLTLSLTFGGAEITGLTNASGLTYATRANSGVGATLTNAGTQAALNIDNVALSVGNRVMVRLQTNAAQNGVYTVTTVGTVSTNWVLTRATDSNKVNPSDPNGVGTGDYYYTQDGDINAGDSHVLTTEPNTMILGYTDLTFTQFSGAVVYTGGTNINITGQTISLTGTVAATNGGTGTNTVTTGDLLYGSATNTWSKLAAGSAYRSLTMNAAGTNVEWNAVSLNQANAVSGTLGATNGGTGQSGYTTGDTLYSSATNTLAKLSGNTTTTPKYMRQVGTGSASQAPTWDTLAASDITSGTLAVARGGTNIGSYTTGDLIYASGTTTLATLADAATGNVLLSGGAGVAPAYGKVGLGTHISGTLAVSNGGTGATNLTGYVYGNGTGAMTASTTIPNAATTATATNTNSAIVARDGSGNFSAGTVTAALSGNATTATTLQTARNINGVSFNGSANITVTASTTAALTAGSFLTSGGTFDGSTARTFAVNATNLNTVSTVVARDGSGNFSAGTITASLSGNATTATTATTANATAAALTAGTYLTSGGTFNGSTARTFAVDATSANTASKVVARDASGNFSAGTITATLSGNASTATTATNQSGGSVAATTGTFSTNLLVGSGAGVDPSSVTGFAAGLISEPATSFSAQGMAFGPSAGNHGAIVYGSGLMYFGTENGSDNTMGVKATLSSAGVFNATGGFSGSGASLTSLNGSNISSGTVAVARLGSGSPSSSNFLRGDGTWAAASSNTTSFGLYENAAVISANYTVSNGNNAISAGPITVNSGVTVTVPSGSTWTVT